MHLWVQLASRPAGTTPARVQSASCHSARSERDQALIESIQIIATAMRTGDCNLSEGAFACVTCWIISIRSND